MTRLPSGLGVTTQMSPLGVHILLLRRTSLPGMAQLQMVPKQEQCCVGRSRCASRSRRFLWSGALQRRIF